MVIMLILSRRWPAKAGWDPHSVSSVSESTWAIHFLHRHPLLDGVEVLPFGPVLRQRWKGAAGLKTTTLMAAPEQQLTGPTGVCQSLAPETIGGLKSTSSGFATLGCVPPGAN